MQSVNRSPNPVCPLTGSDDVEFVKEYDVAKLIAQWSELFGIDVATEFQGVTTIHKYKSRPSGLFFYEPIECEGSGELYEKLSSIPWYYTPEKWEHRLALQECKGGSRILEVGCGGGEFLRKAKSKGCQCVGLEINPNVDTDSRTRNFEIRNQTLSECAAEEEDSFDIVCAFQVLEHTANPKQFLLDCVKATKKNGLLILGTPNSDSFLKRSHNLLDLPPHHMGGWSKEPYCYLEKILPLSLKSLYYETLEPYHFDYFLGTYRDHFVSTNDWKKIFFRGWLCLLLRFFLSLGFARFIRGQCMVAVYRKLY